MSEAKLWRRGNYEGCVGTSPLASANTGRMKGFFIQLVGLMVLSFTPEIIVYLLRQSLYQP